jgi:hypothetical protein
MNFEQLQQAFEQECPRKDFDIYHLNAYVDKLRQYPIKCQDIAGLCYYASHKGHGRNYFSYDVWAAMARLEGTVAHEWEERDWGEFGRKGGPTPERLEMCAKLIAELDALIADYQKSQQ